MDIERKPTKDVHDALNRLEEECSELIKAICKARRFGIYSFHKNGNTGAEEIMLEAHDVRQLLADVQTRYDDGQFEELLNNWR
jgi:hypothetical protein